jgi:hypothetical protein
MRPSCPVQVHLCREMWAAASSNSANRAQPAPGAADGTTSLSRLELGAGGGGRPCAADSA